MDLKKLIYKGEIFPIYCLNNGIPFDDFNERYVRMRKNKKLDKYSDEYLIEYIIRNFYSRKPTNSPYKCKYFVGDSTASEFARQQGVLPSSVKGAIRSGLIKDPNASVAQIAIAFAERNKNKYMFTYENKPLTDACKDHNISREYVMIVFYEEYPDHDKMTDEEKDAAIKIIMDTFIASGITKRKK